MESVGVINQRAETRPDFRHVSTWIFDLDNTLYRADNGIFARIESRMTDYVTDVLKLPRDQARIRQKQMYREYGTTMNGLMQLHGIDPDHYLHFVHDIDLGDLPADPVLGTALARLPGRRFVFTNGCRSHAARILDRLGITALFDAVWDIRSMGFVPKPQRTAYERVIAQSGVDPKAAAMFEDISHNLLVPRDLGMTTVWLDTQSEFSHHGPQVTDNLDHVGHTISDLPQFLHSIRTSP
jgi:putative hydrolase of the HAD superfamily